MKHFFCNHLLPLFFAVIVVFILFYNLNWGVGISPDSTTYIEGARNALKGNGIERYLNGTFQTISHFPPLYPLCLAFLSLFLGTDPVFSATILSCLLFALNLVLTFHLALYWSKSSAVAWFALSFMVVSNDILLIHSMAWSEPLFIFFSICGVILLLLFFEKKRMYLFVTAGIAIALALLTRYMGVVIIGTICLWLLMQPDFFLKKKIQLSVAFGGLCSTPLLLWFWFFTKNVNSRSWVFHLISVHKLENGLAVLLNWVIPSFPWISGVVIFFFLFVVIRKIATRPWRKVSSFPIFLLLYCLIYTSFLVFSISFLDKNTPLDNRILSPLLPFVGIAIGYYFFLKRKSHFWWCFFASSLFLGFHIKQSFHERVLFFSDGVGYFSRPYMTSEILELVKKIPPDVKIISNAPELVYIHLGRYTDSIPEMKNLITGKNQSGFQSAFLNMVQSLNTDKCVVIFFDLVSRPQLPTLEYVLESGQIDQYKICEDGALLVGKMGVTKSYLNSKGVIADIATAKSGIIIPLFEHSLNIHNGSFLINSPYSISFNTTTNDLYFVWPAPEPIPVLSVEFFVEFELLQDSIEETFAEVFLEDPVTKKLIHKKQLLTTQTGEKVEFVFSANSPKWSSLIRIDPITTPGSARVSNIKVYIPKSFAEEGRHAFR